MSLSSIKTIILTWLHLKEETHQLYKDRDDIINWLEKHSVKGYTLVPHEKYGYIVDVDGAVILNEKGLRAIKVKFNHVTQDFHCEDNNLKSLSGSPYSVGGFYCDHNKLTSLKGGPKFAEEYHCSNNQLTSLEYAPYKIVGSFYCVKNGLKTLEGAPVTVGNVFNCASNKLTSLQYAPQKVREDFYCSFNQLTSLEHSPQVGKEFICNSNQLTSLKGLNSHPIHKINCSDNQLTSLQFCPIVTYLNCKGNNLETLEFIPEEVRGYIEIDNNEKINITEMNVKVWNLSYDQLYAKHKQEMVTKSRNKLENELGKSSSASKRMKV